MKWEVRLTGDPDDLRELPQLMAGEDASVYEREGAYYLGSLRFRSLANADAVKSVATRILSSIKGVLHLQCGHTASIELAEIISVGADGRRHGVVFLEATLRARATITYTVLRADGTVEMVNPASVTNSWVALAWRDSAVEKALRLYGMEAQDWPSLYRLFEVIQEDVGGNPKIEKQGWATTRAIRRFSRSANSVAAAGDSARHGRERTAPPVDPMSLREARSFVQALLEKWLRSKAQG